MYDLIEMFMRERKELMREDMISLHSYYLTKMLNHIWQDEGYNKSIDFERFLMEIISTVVALDGSLTERFSELSKNWEDTRDFDSRSMFIA